MPNKQRTKGVEFYRNPKKTGDTFQAESKAASRGKFFRSFHRTKTKAYMTTYNDIHYLSVIKYTLSNINDGANVEAAFDNALDIAWEMGAKTGNIKDLVTTQETAFKNWLRFWTILAFETAAQAMLRPFVPAFTEGSGTITSTTTISPWVQADWDAFIASLERLDCPDFIYRFMQPYLFYIKMTDTYEKSGITIPASYVLPICHVNILTNLQANRENAKAASAEAMLHCKKFGIPFGKFSLDKLKAREVNRKDIFQNQDIVALFGFMPFNYTWKTGPTVTLREQVACLTGADLVADYNVIKYPFIDGQPLSMVHALYPLYTGTYDATNEPYANILYPMVTATTEYQVNIFHTSLLGTAWTVGLMSGNSSLQVLELFMAMYNTAANFGMTWSGTEVTTAQTHDVEDWIALKENSNICIGTGITGGEALDSVQNAFKYMIYGE